MLILATLTGLFSLTAIAVVIHKLQQPKKAVVLVKKK
jgi:hypothetical protein